ncbi:MAG: tetratricopeptide repeat protein [Thermodesulfovibrionales bacterium]|nr:tetratricopeptide repeat protein [Thermodesulfovibrionales bacterium]
MNLSKKPKTDEEKIINTVAQFKEQFKEKQKNLVYVLVISLAVILIVSGVFIYMSTAKTKASELEAEGYKYFYSARGENAPAMYSKALESFKNAYNTRKSAYSLFYIANCYVELGKIDDAINSLNELVNKFSDPTNLSFAYNKLSSLYLKKGDTQKALDSLDKLKKTKGAPLQDMAYMQSATILESLGKTEEAKAQYKELIDKFPTSLLSAQAKAKLK